MELVVSLVHEKAIKEPLYSQCYARLTQFLSQEVSLFSQNLYLNQKRRRKLKKKESLILRFFTIIFSHITDE